MGWNTLDEYGIEGARLIPLEDLDEDARCLAWAEAIGNWGHSWADATDEAAAWAEENPGALILMDKNGKLQGWVTDEDADEYHIVLFGGTYSGEYTTSYPKLRDEDKGGMFDYHPFDLNDEMKAELRAEARVMGDQGESRAMKAMEYTLRVIYGTSQPINDFMTELHKAYREGFKE